MRETKTIEFKESVTNSFLKTVSAYANYDGGTVLFGVNDHGQAVGLSDPIQQCLNIENRINDAISIPLIFVKRMTWLRLPFAPEHRSPIYTDLRHTSEAMLRQLKWTTSS